MKTNPIRPLEGMKDSFELEYSKLDYITQTLGNYLSEFNFKFVNPPLLEKTELFLRKSGGEFGTRLYSFTDPGGNKVSLRPEFTSSIIRMFIQSKNPPSFPIKWQYSGPVFRYTKVKNNEYRQFSQLGAELIGLNNIEVDAELISIAFNGLKALNLGQYSLNIGDMAIINTVLDKLELSDRARGFLIRSIPSLNKKVQSLENLEAAKNQFFLSPKSNLKDKLDLDNIEPKSLKSLIKPLFTQGTFTAVGQRTSDEIIDRFVNRIQENDDILNVEKGMELLTKLAKVQGKPTEALLMARKISDEFDIEPNTFDTIENLVGLLYDAGIDQNRLNIDFGLVRGISYYSGVIFDIGHPNLMAGNSLGGGGRYDSLVETLGGTKGTPAMGFAYNLDSINMLLPTNPEITNEELNFDG